MKSIPVAAMVLWLLGSPGTALALFSAACNAEIAGYSAAVSRYHEGRTKAVAGALGALPLAFVMKSAGNDPDAVVSLRAGDIKQLIEAQTKRLAETRRALEAASKLIQCASNEPHQ